MSRVFGVPAGALSIWLTVILAIAVGTLVMLALRNRVFFKIGLRNIPRRRSRSALIVLGLMLGTAIISSALLTGDTLARSARSAVVESLGLTDETVTAGTDAAVLGDFDLDAAKPYFAVDDAIARVDRATADLPVDGVIPAIIEPIAAQHAAGGRTEPNLTLFAPDAARADRFGFADVAGLDTGEVLLNDDAADELRASAGDDIVILAGSRFLDLHVAGVGAYRGTSTDGPAVVLSLRAAQQLLDRPGKANYVLVSNTGDETSGASETERVEQVLDEAVEPIGLDAQPAKRDGLDAADASGNQSVQLFTTFGSFSMAAGVLLIFLIFVMLATERRPEMGMARAVGTQRRHLVQTFVYEGAVYDVVAGAVGALLGVGASFLMVRAVAGTFAGEGLELSYSLSARSLVISYAMGVLVTLAVVSLSAWRVSRLNIVSAIRDLPESETGARPRTRWLLVASGIGFGTLFAVNGATSQVYLPWMLGLSIVILSFVPIVKLLGRSERLAYTSAGGLLVALWLLPLGFFDSLFGEMTMDFSIWIAGGLIIVVGATWLITYNVDVLLGLVSWLASPFASLRPVARMAVAYPLKSRFRTGVTLSMFMLVVFTLVTGSTIPSAFVNAFDDVDRFGGGYDIRVSTAPAAAVKNLAADLPDEVAEDIVATGAQSFVPIEAVQDGSGRSFERYPLRGVDKGFLERTTYEFASVARGYETPRDVWNAVQHEPGLAVVDAYVAPRRDNWGFGVMPNFQLSGFYIEDGTFEPVPLTVNDPLTGTTLRLTVIGVLSDNTPYSMSGITVAQAVLAPFGERRLPNVHHFAVREGADASVVADSVEAALLARGAEAETYADLLDEAVGSSRVFIRLVQGFMSLGLLVGVTALGVISARTVVERRQQLGMLRAIGFQTSTIRRILLTETSIVAVTAIVAGGALGLMMSYNVIADSKSQLGYDAMSFAVPWLNLALIFGSVIVAALVTTLASTLRAMHVHPAEALRYQ